jgi:hypothetical protein
VVGYIAIKNQETSIVETDNDENEPQISKSLWIQIDLSGAVLLVLGLSAQLAALSMGGNNYPWTDVRVIVSFVVSVILLALFIVVEIRTRAIPVMPMYMLKGQLAISNLISNVCVGMAAYAVSIPRERFIHLLIAFSFCL